MMSSPAVVTGGPRAQREKPRRAALAAVFVAIPRLILPVLGLLLAFAAVALYSDTPMTLLDSYFRSSGGKALPGTWLTWGHVLLPAAFFAIHLCNRRYGHAYAVAQIIAAWMIVGALIWMQSAVPQLALPLATVPAPRVLVAFAGAFFFSQLVAAVVFYLMRGVHWWTAPLLGSIWASAVFAAVFYPAGFAGDDMPWLGHLGLHLGIMVAVSLLLLVPYWIFRPLVRPLPGFGGY